MASGAPPVWPAGANNAWNQALAIMAAHPRPETLPPDVYLRHDEHTLTIYDGYPKAKFHFLIMPRIPFKLTKNGQSVEAKNIDNIQQLLRTDHALEVLERLRTAAEELKPMIKDEMRQTPLPGRTEPAGVTWTVNMGFHAIPSMQHLHLHVLSSDLISPCMKNKKHYNSFMPRGDFFVGLHDTIELVKRGETKLRKPNGAAHYKHERDNANMISDYTGEVLRNMPIVKAHLQEMWENQMRKREERLRLTGTQDSAKKVEKRAAQRGAGAKSQWERVPRPEGDPGAPKGYDHLTGKRKRAVEREVKSMSRFEADKWELHPPGQSKARAQDEASETEDEDAAPPPPPPRESVNFAARRTRAEDEASQTEDEDATPPPQDSNDLAASKWISEAEADDVLPREPRGKAKSKAKATQPEHDEAPRESDDLAASKWISEAEADDVLPREPRGKAKGKGQAKQSTLDQMPGWRDGGGSGDRFV